MHDFINRIHDLEVFRTDFGNRQVQEVNHLIFPALLCLTALLYLAERKNNTKNLFFVWSLFNVLPIAERVLKIGVVGIPAGARKGAAAP